MDKVQKRSTMNQRPARGTNPNVSESRLLAEKIQERLVERQWEQKIVV